MIINLYLYAIALLTTGKAGASMYDPKATFEFLESGRRIVNISLTSAIGISVWVCLATRDTVASAIRAP